MKKSLCFSKTDFVTDEAWERFMLITPDALDDAFWGDENGNFSFSEEFTGNKVVRVFVVYNETYDQCPETGEY